ncbi:MAG: hypothetical protein GY913_21800 [Proteobacteria bacterium]|nr:hypothetical protein [Actinomycetes bacterium]MCP4919545.1 hypothetical protein [Pseudomonadota bacterium]
MDRAHLPQALKLFNAPAGTLTGFKAAAGEHDLLEEAHFGGEVWFRLRHGWIAAVSGGVWATNLGPASAPLSGAIAPSRLWAAADLFKGWGYDLHSPSFPRAPKGVSGLKTSGRKSNCCAFVGAVVPYAFEDALGDDFEWGLARHNEVMITDASRLSSPTEAFVTAGVAEKVNADTSHVPAWSVVQLWRDASRVKGGHTIIVVAHDQGTDSVLTLECNKAYRQSGPGHRGIGNYGVSLDSWQIQPDIWTWSRFKSEYPDRSVCALAVER